MNYNAETDLSENAQTDLNENEQTDLNENAFEAGILAKNYWANFDEKVLQFKALPFRFHLGILTWLVDTSEFEHESIKETVSYQTGACVQDGKARGWLLRVV